MGKKQKMYEIIHEDEAVIIVNKTAGILTIPDRYNPDLPNVYNDLQQKYSEIYTVHRLDKGTSGILCFARTKAAHKHLNDQFEKRATTKTYGVLVQGNMPVMEETETIDAPIDKHPTQAGLMQVHRKGKPSTTLYKSVEAFKQYSWIEANILTGRTHQIRVHFAHIGFPLAVDPQYSQVEGFYLSNFKKNRFNLGKFQEERPLVSRVSLHALRLSFEHPLTKQMVEFECSLPKDLKAALQQLRKWNK